MVDIITHLLVVLVLLEVLVVEEVQVILDLHQKLEVLVIRHLQVLHKVIVVVRVMVVHVKVIELVVEVVVQPLLVVMLDQEVDLSQDQLLVDQEVADDMLPLLAAEFAAKGVELRGCERTCAILEGISAATEDDWHEEYLAPILAVRVVDGLDGAIEHINRYSSQHTDSIITENYTWARRFLTEVDSSSVMVNASTRFADGFEYGLGAEIGISTDKIHARGPVGLEGLTSQKYVVFGDGHIRT